MHARPPLPCHLCTEFISSYAVRLAQGAMPPAALVLLFGAQFGAPRTAKLSVVAALPAFHYICPVQVVRSFATFCPKHDLLPEHKMVVGYLANWLVRPPSGWLTFCVVFLGRGRGRGEFHAVVAPRGTFKRGRRKLWRAHCATAFVWC